jgi:hypothetical protein
MNFIKGLAAAWRLMLGPVGLLSDHQLSRLSRVRWRVVGCMVVFRDKWQWKDVLTAKKTKIPRLTGMGLKLCYKRIRSPVSTHTSDEDTKQIAKQLNVNYTANTGAAPWGWKSGGWALGAER